MTLDDLYQTLLQARDGAGVLRLAPTTLSSAQIGELLALPYLDLPMQTLTIEGAGVSPPDASGVAVSGASTLFRFSNAQVEANFTLDATNTPQLALKLMLPDGSAGSAWRFADSFPQLADTIFDDVALSSPPGPFLLFASAPYEDQLLAVSFAAGLSFYGALTPSADFFGPVTMVLGPLASEVASGPIVPLPNGPTIDLTLDLQSSFNKYFPSLSVELPVELRLVSAFDQTVSPTALRFMAGLDLRTTFDLGTGSITLDTLLTGDEIGVLKLRGRIDDLPQPSPEQLAGLLGGDELASSLPSQYQGSDALHLSGFGFGVSLETLTPASLWLELSALEHDPWVLLPGELELTNVRAWFMVEDPLESTRSFQTAIFAELDVPTTQPICRMEVAAYAPHYAIQASLVEGTTVSLTDLLARFLPVSDAPEFLLEELGLLYEFRTPKNRLTFQATIGEGEPWVLPLGGPMPEAPEVPPGYAPIDTPAPLQAQFITITLNNYSNGDSMGGQIYGELNILGAVTDFSYQLPGSFRVSAYIPSFEVNLQRIASELAGSSWTPPSWLPDFTLPETYLAVERDVDGEQSIFTLLLQAQPTGLGILGLQVLREQGTWGFAAGMDLIVSNVSDFPNLGVLKPLDDLFHLSNLLLVISSIASPAFNFPDMSHLGPHGVGGRQIALPGQAGGLQAGVTIYADAQLGGSDHLTMIQKLFGLSGDLGVTLFLGENPAQNARLFASVDATIGGVRLDVEFGGALQGGEIGLFLAGVALASLNNQPLEFDVIMLLLDNGALIAGNLKGGPVSFGGMQLSDVALELGVDFEGVPSVGVAATIDTPTFESSLAIFFDSTNADNSMLAGSVSDLTLADVARVIAGGSLPAGLDEALARVGVKGTSQFLLSGGLGDALDNRDLTAIAAAFQAAGVALAADSQSTLLVVNTQGQIWHLTDMTTMRHYELQRQGDQIVGALEAQLYWVPSSTGTQIGTQHFPPGFLLSGTIVFFGLEVSLSIAVVRGQGVSADVALSPVRVGSLLSITSEDGAAGPQLSLATYNQPHFYLTGRVQLLGVSAGVQIRLSKDGLLFDLQGELIPGTSFDLDASFTSLHNFSAGGAVTVGVNRSLDFGPLGVLNVNVGIGGQLTIADHDGAASATFQGAFQFGAGSYGVGPVALDLSREALKELGATVEQHVVAIFHQLMHSVRSWFDLVKQGLVAGINGLPHIVQVLRHHFGQDKHAIATLLRELLGGGVEPIADALRAEFQLDSRELARLLRETAYGVQDVTRALRGEFDKSHREAAAILRDVGYSVDEVALALQQKFENDRVRAIQVMHEVGYDAGEVAGAIARVYQQGAADVAALLRAANYEVEDIARGLHHAFGLDSRAVVGALRQAGYEVKAVGRALRQVFDKNVGETSRILQELGYEAHELAKVLRHVYDKAAKEAGDLLKDLGYAKDQVTDALQKAFDMGEREVEKLIKDIF